MQPYDQGWGQPQQQGWAPPPQQGGAGGWGPPPQQWGPPPAQAPQQPAPPPPPSADDFLTGGHRAAKFETYGQVIGGRIVEPPRVEQQTDPKTRVPQFYPSGDPKWVLLVSIQAQPPTGDDDGIRTLYVKADMRRAVQQARADSGAERLEVGGALQVRYVREEPNSTGSGVPKKIYDARYQPPAGGGNVLQDSVARPANAPISGLPGAGHPPPATPTLRDEPPF